MVHTTLDSNYAREVTVAAGSQSLVGDPRWKRHTLSAIRVQYQYTTMLAAHHHGGTRNIAQSGLSLLWASLVFAHAINSRLHPSLQPQIDRFHYLGQLPHAIDHIMCARRRQRCTRLATFGFLFRGGQYSKLGLA